MPEPLVHRCIVPSGPAAGNKHSQEICPSDIEYESACSICGRELAPDLRTIVAHIYEEMLSLNPR